MISIIRQSITVDSCHNLPEPPVKFTHSKLWSRRCHLINWTDHISVLQYHVILHSLFSQQSLQPPKCHLFMWHLGCHTAFRIYVDISPPSEINHFARLPEWQGSSRHSGTRQGITLTVNADAMPLKLHNLQLHFSASSWHYYYHLPCRDYNSALRNTFKVSPPSRLPTTLPKQKERWKYVCIPNIWYMIESSDSVTTIVIFLRVPPPLSPYATLATPVPRYGAGH